ncbi:MAG: FKBP-type peptidyl-prolyl cis-trans isomerase [Spirosomaceae bacterium]|nr:FKBP-type peptidyl-prolyl cis-trans isomerase [Spirosomataceae bacterium]
MKGFDEGIAKLKVGEKGTLIFPSSLGYGAQGAGGDIPGNAPLSFDIEVLAAR